LVYLALDSTDILIRDDIENTDNHSSTDQQTFINPSTSTNNEQIGNFILSQIEQLNQQEDNNPFPMEQTTIPTTQSHLQVE
jgi:hypothetical protein